MSLNNLNSIQWYMSYLRMSIRWNRQHVSNSQIIWIGSIKNLNLFYEAADFLFLQDIRLGTEGEGILKKHLEFHGTYNTYTNSTQASHGVAILINTTLPYKILKSNKCRLENYILFENLFKRLSLQFWISIQSNCIPGPRLHGKSKKRHFKSW